MDRQQHLRHVLALFHTRELGPKRINAILDHFLDLDQFFALLHANQLQNILPDAICTALKSTDFKLIDADLEWASQPHNHIVSCFDEDYPQLLKELSVSPPILFCRGQRNLLQQPHIAIVGSRNPSPVGVRTAATFSRALGSSGFTIVSGMALGIDTAAHFAAVETESSTIAVLGSGLDVIYPRSNERLYQKLSESGLVLSEFPLGTEPLAKHFPRRNRIISGLSLGVLVVEAALKSGSLITARYALEQGREVFAIPGSIHHPLAKGCHHLLQQGAKLVQTEQDILEELPQFFRRRISEKSAAVDMINSPNLDQEYYELLECVGFEPTPPDVLSSRTGINADKLASMLLTLELHGLISIVPGGYMRLQRQGTASV